MGSRSVCEYGLLLLEQVVCLLESSRMDGSSSDAVESERTLKKTSQLAIKVQLGQHRNETCHVNNSKKKKKTFFCLTIYFYRHGDQSQVEKPRRLHKNRLFLLNELYQFAEYLGSGAFINTMHQMKELLHTILSLVALTP